MLLTKHYSSFHLLDDERAGGKTSTHVWQIAHIKGPSRKQAQGKKPRSNNSKERLALTVRHGHHAQEEVHSKVEKKTKALAGNPFTSRMMIGNILEQTLQSEGAMAAGHFQLNRAQFVFLQPGSGEKDPGDDTLF
jgi:hypothetical protein